MPTLRIKTRILPGGRIEGPRTRGSSKGRRSRSASSLTTRPHVRREVFWRTWATTKAANCSKRQKRWIAILRKSVSRGAIDPPGFRSDLYRCELGDLPDRADRAFRIGIGPTVGGPPGSENCRRDERADALGGSRQTLEGWEHSADRSLSRNPPGNSGHGVHRDRPGGAFPRRPDPGRLAPENSPMRSMPRRPSWPE